MTAWDAFIFGIVEGVSEFLPISSTGHLILTARFLGVAQTEFVKSFEVAIQLGAILAVVVLYGKTLFKDFEILKRIAAAFIPTAVMGLVFYKVIKKSLLGNTSVVLWSLLIGGVLLILFECWYKKHEGEREGLAKITYGQAVLIGCFQSIAILPGVSRAAATIVGGLLLGLKRKTIVEFSFLLAVPTMLAATALDFLKSAGVFPLDQFGLLAVGFGAAFVTALFSIQFLLSFIKKNNFIPFGIYRVLVAVFLWKS